MNSAPMNLPELPRHSSLSAGIPQDTLGGLCRYVKHRIPPGDFLTAVLSNDLFAAVGRADEANAAALPAICRYIWNNLPRQCFGDPRTVREWLNAQQAGVSNEG